MLLNVCLEHNYIDIIMVYALSMELTYFVPQDAKLKMALLLSRTYQLL